MLEAPAAAKEKAAMATLGYLLIEGEVCEKSPRKGFALMHGAAVLGDLCAQYNCGYFLLKGMFCEGSAENRNKGIEWLEKASDRGYYPSKLVLGHAYFEGTLIGKDHKKALDYLLQCHKKGYSVAHLIAFIYFKGSAGERDYFKALEFYTMALIQGKDVSQGVIEFIKKQLNRQGLIRNKSGRKKQGKDPHELVAKLHLSNFKTRAKVKIMI